MVQTFVWRSICEKVKNLTDGIAAVAVLPMMLEVQTGLIAFEYGQKLLSLQGLVM